MDQVDQNEALTNFKSLQTIFKVYKQYKVPQDLQNDDLQNKLFVILLGVTGVGKSSLFNFLRGAKMKIIKDFFYVEIKLENDEENEKYKISHEKKAQTQEPTHISIKHNDQEMILVDTPGYAATETADFSKEEQQWLDSLKMRKYFKKCKKCVLLLIMEDKPLIERSSQLDTQNLLDYIQNLTGIPQKSEFTKKMRIIFNKSTMFKQDDKNLKQIFVKHLEQLCGKNQVKENQTLQQYIEILSNKNDKDEYEFHIVKEIQDGDQEFASQQKKEELLNFIQGLDPLTISPQPFFQNQNTLNSHLKNIKVNLYQQEIDNFFQELDLATDEIMKLDRKIVFSESLISKGKKWVKILFKKKELIQYEILKENQECQIIYKIMEHLVKCHKTLANIIAKQDEMNKPNHEKVNLHKKRTKKFITKKLVQLFKIINEYQNKNYILDQFIDYYRIIRKFSVPNLIVKEYEQDLINYKNQMLLIPYMRDQFQRQIQKISSFRDKLDNLLFGMEFQIDFEIRNYKIKLFASYENVHQLIKMFNSIYSTTLVWINKKKSDLENFIQNDKVINRYESKQFRSSSINYQAILEKIDEILKVQKIKRELVCLIFDAPSDTVLDHIKLKELSQKFMDDIEKMKSRLETIQNLKDKYYINKKTILAVIQLRSSLTQIQKIQSLVDLLVQTQLFEHNDQDLLDSLMFMRDNCYLGYLANLNFFRSKGEYSRKFFQPALDKLNKVKERIEKDLDKINKFMEENRKQDEQEFEVAIKKICNIQ